MAEKKIFRVIVTLSFLISAFAFGNCGNTANLSDSTTLNENPPLDNARQATSVSAMSNIAENTGLLELRISEIQGEELNIKKGNFLITSVEVKPENGDWIIISDYGLDGRQFEYPGEGEAATLLDVYPVPANAYKKVRLNLDAEKSSILIESATGEKWVDLDNESDEHHLRAHYDFTIENQTLVTMYLKVEAERISSHRHDREDDDKRGRHSDRHENSANSDKRHGWDSDEDQEEYLKIKLEVENTVAVPITVIDPIPENGGSTGGTPKPTPAPVQAPTPTPQPIPVPVVTEPVWTVQASPLASALLGIVDNGTDKIAVGSINTGISSRNGVTWAPELFPGKTLNLNSIATNGSIFAVVGDAGQTYYSITTATNRIWYNGGYAAKSSVNLSLKSVTYGNNTFVAVGDRGGIFVSANGSIWTQVYTLATANLKSVIWNGTKFIAVGDTGTVMSSVDGATWAIVPLFASTSFFTGVASNGATTVVVGTRGDLWQTRDMINFTSYYGTTATNLNGVFWNGTFFIAYGDAGVILISQDGVKWIVQNPVTTNSLRGGASFTDLNGVTRNTIVGDNGVILTSL